ncbi:MAG TPA: molybdopterin cofactor-binding domain-containing protein, partial [Nocardioidaceae bacterium]|nr:molybdopterin cofactor-binding domain-containing protein [Nocardioidaceae bacterium]
MSAQAPSTTTIGTGRIGDSPARPDGILKVTGEFAYASDLWMEDMIWGVTLRSPHPHARIRSVDIGPALATPGVYAVLLADDVPGRNAFGLEHDDQPVLADGVVRYQGEPVALVAADHPEIARQAAKRVVVDYEPLPRVTDGRRALDPDAPTVHPDGNLVRHLKIRKGDPEVTAPVVVELDFEVGMQDQAFLGPESGLAVPAEDGGVDLYVATQWLHVDQRQICQALGMPLEKVRLSLSGVGGAFGGREDLSMHVHACLLALHTGKPVKMVYNREESFFGHVHRHPAYLHYEYGADEDGRLVYGRANIVFDGGAYASSTAAVVGNGGTMGLGPYRFPNVHVDCFGVYTNNPPCGAMRGFGCVQAAFAHEAMMDELADRIGVDRLAIRQLNGMTEGDQNITGQVIDSAAPVAELLRIVHDLPLPPAATGELDLRSLPGGVSNTTHGESVVRGIGYAVTYKNVGFSEGFDDYSTARVRLETVAGEPLVTVHTAAAEVGQGLVTIEQQICRTELGVDRVVVHPKDTSVGSGGSTSASRQTYVTGGAVKAACEAVRRLVLERAAVSVGQAADSLRLEGGKVVSLGGEVVAGLADVLGDQPVEETVEWRHRPTQPVDPETGQGNAHVQYAFSAHRAVVDVDTELGLVKVVALDTAQDVGRALNPAAVVGQIHGGSAQGMGLALM